MLRNKMAEGQADRYFGLDVQVMRALAGLFNFTLQYIEPPPGERWGHQLDNGSWNGMVGLLGRGEGDIGVGVLYVTSLGGRQEFQEYSAPYDNEEPCFLIRREKELSRWQSLALPFTLSTWLTVILGMILGGPVFYCLSKPSLPSEKNLCGRSVMYTTMYTLGIHFRSAQHIVPTSTTLQVLVVFMWVYVIVLTVGYSSNLTAFLTVARSPSGINTFLQLYQSSFPIFGLGPFFGNVMAASTISHIRGLSQQFISVPSFEEVDREMTKGKVVVLQECFMPYSVALGLQSHSPLKPNLDWAVTWVLESGLVNHWFLESIRQYKMYQAEVTGGYGTQRSTENEEGWVRVCYGSNGRRR
ncbi:hypothetical protein Pcinc_006657 [Petrolisthes cinctipes]|uniref:Ionotropic glutamate receptor L-glutamate and glycine-binding domain-containing protein n=1 Tax=Petrolisthes cinctipes TaxID=88211 RepID=A0AAE1GCI3_PETCI|nr:hypothetical protein Pcinc_006657 [Petrolisthes cinctipes]